MELLLLVDNYRVETTVGPTGSEVLSNFFICGINGLI
jgi:hypothetical protein